MIVGCYTLDLYCDNQGEYPDGIHDFYEFPQQYSDGGSSARAQARRDGWLISDKRQLCPKCSGKRDDA